MIISVTKVPTYPSSVIEVVVMMIENNITAGLIFFLIECYKNGL